MSLVDGPSWEREFGKQIGICPVCHRDHCDCIGANCIGWDAKAEEIKTEMRTFETGATRNLDEDKFDYEGFYNPLVMEEFANYMHGHRKQADGKLRDSDNWQKGIPLSAYMKSICRHVIDLWKAHRGYPAPPKKESCCAILFNAQGYLLELIKEENNVK